MAKKDKNDWVEELNKQAERLDNFYNSTNGFGGERSTIQQTGVTQRLFLGRNTIEALYQENGTARNVIDIPAWEMIKGGVDFFVSDEQDETLIDEIEEELERLDWEVWNYKALIEAGKSGGGGLIFTMDDGSDQYDQELNNSKGVINIQVGDRWQMTPLDIENDMFNENYSKPRKYRAAIPYYSTAFSETVHFSRVIRFTGPFTGIQNQAFNHGWSEPTLTHIFNDIRKDTVGSDTGSEAFQKFWQYKFKSPNMEKWKGAKDDSILGAIRKRMSNLFQRMGINNVAVYGAGEEFEVTSIPIAGLVELMDSYPKRVSSSSRVPYDKLYTGESGSMGADIIEGSRKNFQDWILARQKMNYAPAIRQWLKIISTYMGFDPDKVGFRFRSLEQLDPLQEAEMRLKVAQADQIYQQEGNLSPNEVSNARFAGRVPDYTSMRLEEGDRKSLEEIDEMEQEEMEKKTEALKQNNIKGKDAEK
jgi:hypothetical protein